jgi:hypothetical protein
MPHFFDSQNIDKIFETFVKFFLGILAVTAVIRLVVIDVMGLTITFENERWKWRRAKKIAASEIVAEEQHEKISEEIRVVKHQKALESVRSKPKLFTPHPNTKVIEHKPAHRKEHLQ